MILRVKADSNRFGEKKKKDYGESEILPQIYSDI